MEHRIGLGALAVVCLLASASGGLPAQADGLGSFERAAELSPQDPQVQFNLGVMCLKAGDYSQAARALKHATALAPRDAEAWEAYGTALLELRRFSEAEGALQRSTGLDPARAGAWQTLARALAVDGSQGGPAAAVDAYARAARLRPRDPAPLLDQGLLLARLGRVPRALSVLREVSRMPGGEEAFRALCMLYNKMGQYARAEDACRHAVRADPRAESWYNLGFALQQDGHAAEARHAYQKAIQADPGHAPALYALALLAYQAGDAEGALRGFQAALKARGGDYPEAAYNAAVLLGDQGRFEEAADLYRAFLRNHPDDADAQANLRSVVDAGLASLLEQGKDAYERGSFEAAREAWKRARRLDPDNGEATRMLKLTEGRGRAAQAARAASVAARSAVARRLKADDSKTRRHGLAALEAGRNAEAVRLLSFYLKNNPDDGAVRKALTEARGHLRAAVDELLRRASDALASGDRSLAGSLAAKALEQDPGSARARTLQREAGRPAAVKAVDPEVVRKLYYAGVEQYLAGDLPAAVATWTEVLRDQPDHLDAQRSLARARLELQALRQLDRH